jgi:hypothetical protein
MLNKFLLQNKKNNEIQKNIDDIIYYEGFVYEEFYFDKFLENKYNNHKVLLNYNFELLFKISVLLFFVYTVYSVNLINKNIKTSDLMLKKSLLIIQKKILNSKINVSVGNIFLEKKIDEILNYHHNLEYDYRFSFKKIKDDINILLNKITIIEDNFN